MPRKKRAAASASLAPVEGERAGVRSRPTSLLDTRVIYCFSLSAFGGESREEAVPNRKSAIRNRNSPRSPFNGRAALPRRPDRKKWAARQRNPTSFWGETKEKRAFVDRHASTQAYIHFMHPRCVELARVLKPVGRCSLSAVRSLARTGTPEDIRAISKSDARCGGSLTRMHDVYRP